jgi:hypothetical protein
MVSIAFTKLAASIAARNAGRLLGVTGLASGTMAGVSHALDAINMGVDDALTYGKSYYSPILRSVGAEDLARVNDEAAEKTFNAINAKLQAANPGDVILNWDTPSLLRTHHLTNVGLGGALGALHFRPVVQKKPSFTGRLFGV